MAFINVSGDFGAMKSKLNILLITIDSLRWDHTGCLGYSKEITPSLDRIAASGLTFKQAISNGPETRTSFKSILTSTYPLTGGWSPHLESWRVSLAEVLWNNGYHTAAFHSNPFLSQCGFDRGFDVFEDLKSQNPLSSIKSESKSFTDILMSLSDFVYNWIGKTALWRPFRIVKHSIGWFPYQCGDNINDKTIVWLRSVKCHPFFLWLHYMDVHYPYLPNYPNIIYRLAYARLDDKMMYSPDRFSSKELAKLIAFYDAKIKIKYVDGCIGRLLKSLEEMNINSENTVTVITGDHGEAFLEHGLLRHEAYLYEENIRVPLVICGPQVDRGIVNDQVSLIDLATTILDMLNIKIGAYPFRGRSLYTSINHREGRERPVYCETPLFSVHGILGTERFAIRKPPWKYIILVKDKVKILQEELYNLQKDPVEKQNRVEEKPILHEFRSMLLAHIRTEREAMSGRVKSRKRIEETSRSKQVYTSQEEVEMKKRLKSLGYL